MISPSLEAHRLRASRRMTSHVIVETPGGDPVWDPDTESMIPGEPTIHYEGQAFVRAAGTAGRVVDAAGQLVLVKGYEVDLPGGIGVAFPEGASLIVTSCPTTPDLVGTRLSIAEAPLTDWQVSRRLLCQLAV